MTILFKRSVFIGIQCLKIGTIILLALSKIVHNVTVMYNMCQLDNGLVKFRSLTLNGKTFWPIVSSYIIY